MDTARRVAATLHRTVANLQAESAKGGSAALHYSAALRSATESSPSDRGEMGYADPMRFEPGELALLAATEEIEIETAAPDGPAHRTIIWVMVDGGDAFIRSVRGRNARWFREAATDPDVVVHVAGRAVPAHVEPADDAVSIRRTNDALTRKYTGIDGYPEMLEPSIMDTTLRLTPS
jgi:hypothetical protein